ELHRPDSRALRENPLLRSRLVVERVGIDSLETDRVAALRGLVKMAAAVMQRTPREDKLYRALYRTYLEPAPTQEAAAEILDLPFSTYRRHLKAGMARLTSILWHWELHGVPA